MTLRVAIEGVAFWASRLRAGFSVNAFTKRVQ